MYPSSMQNDLLEGPQTREIRQKIQGLMDAAAITPPSENAEVRVLELIFQA